MHKSFGPIWCSSYPWLLLERCLPKSLFHSCSPQAAGAARTSSDAKPPIPFRAFVHLQVPQLRGVASCAGCMCTWVAFKKPPILTPLCPRSKSVCALRDSPMLFCSVQDEVSTCLSFLLSACADAHCCPKRFHPKQHNHHLSFCKGTSCFMVVLCGWAASACKVFGWLCCR